MLGRLFSNHSRLYPADAEPRQYHGENFPDVLDYHASSPSSPVVLAVGQKS